MAELDSSFPLPEPASIVVNNYVMRKNAHVHLQACKSSSIVFYKCPTPWGRSYKHKDIKFIKLSLKINIFITIKFAFNMKFSYLKIQIPNYTVRDFVMLMKLMV